MESVGILRFSQTSLDQLAFDPVERFSRHHEIRPHSDA
jgi:hypothetical protein